MFDRGYTNGFSSAEAEKIDSNYFPGQNKLVILLIAIRDVRSSIALQQVLQLILGRLQMTQ